MAVTSFYLVCGITTNQFVDEDNSVECSCSSQLSDRRQFADEWSKKRGVNFLLGKENLISLLHFTFADISYFSGGSFFYKN